MDSGLLGRTNRAFPRIWLRPVLPRDSGDLTALISALDSAGVPIDIGGQPGLWGGLLRGKEHEFIYTGSNAAENATSERHAVEVVQADLIQTLSAIGRETLDIYFVRVRRAMEEFQINGILEALEGARQEGHVRYIGICCDGNPFATLSAWQFHDAFELLQVRRNPSDEESYNTLAPLAKERRVGIVTSHAIEWAGSRKFSSIPGEWISPLFASYDETTLEQFVIGRLSQDHPVIVTVDSADAVAIALQSPQISVHEMADLTISKLVEAYRENPGWQILLEDPDLQLRQAARRQLERV